jgi:hypothetical protein
MKTRFLALLLAFPLPALAQTAVTAQITDSDSQTWNNGSWTATLVSPSGPPQGCTTATTVSGTMSGSGVLTGSLCDNSLVGPSGSTWRFTICPNASARCSQVSTAVSGSTENLSSLLSAGVTAPRFAASFGAYGYADVEVTPNPPPGATYYNVTTPAFRQWSGSAWAAVGGGGGGTVGGSGTIGFFSCWVTNTTTLGNCPMDANVTTTSTVSSSEDLQAIHTGTVFMTLNSTSSGSGAMALRFQTTGLDAVELVGFGTSGSGLTGVTGLFDATSSIFDWSVNSAGDVFFNTPIGGGNVGAGTGSTAGISHTGAATFLSVNGTTIPASATLTQTIASGQTAIPVTALAANTCDASATTATATGAATTDAPTVAYASDPTGVTGYGGGTSGGISIRSWTTVNTFSFKRCNESSASISPGALNLNWKVTR